MVAQGKNDRIWVGTDTGLYTLDGKIWSKYDLPDSGLPGDYIQALAVDPSGRLWIAASAYSTPPGIAVLDGDVWRTYPEQYQDFNDANVIAFDPDGHVWIGYEYGYGLNEPKYFGGIRVFDNQTWIIYTKDNSGLPNAEIEAIAFDDSGRAWIGTYGGGLVVFDGITWKEYTEREGIDDIVNAIAFDTRGRVLVGTFRGLMRFDGQTWTKLIEGNISAILVDQSDRIYASCGYYLLFFDGTSWVKINSDNSPLPDFMYWKPLIRTAPGNEESLLIDGGESGTLLEFTPESLQPKPVALNKTHIFLNRTALWIACAFILLWIANISGILRYVLIGFIPGLASFILFHEIMFDTSYAATDMLINSPAVFFGVLGGLLAGLVAKYISPNRSGRVIAIIILLLGLLFGFASIYFVISALSA